MALINLEELYVISRENVPQRMHLGYEASIGPKFYKKGYANDPCRRLNARREAHMMPFDPSKYVNRWSEETIKRQASDHSRFVEEENIRGPWVIRKATEVFTWVV